MEETIEAMKNVFQAHRETSFVTPPGTSVSKEKQPTRVQGENLSPGNQGKEHGKQGEGGSSVARNLELTGPVKWSAVVADKSLKAKGTSLKFVPPMVKEGKRYAQLDKTKVESLTEIWVTDVILYVVGQTPSIGSVTRFIEQTWNNVAKPTLFLHEKGYFLIKFASLEDRNEILYSGPHMLNSRPMIIKAWSPSFDFQAKVLRVIPLWVRLYNLLLNCWGFESLSRIGSMIGVPLFADECTSKQQRVTFDIASNVML